jgi:glyoxylate reductase
MVSARVLITAPLPPGGTDPLDGFEIVDTGTDVDAVVCQLTDRFDAARLDELPSVKVVATVSVGFDHVDVAAATARAIAVCNTPGVLDETTADLAFALILSATRTLSDAERDLRSGQWTGWRLLDHLSHDVHGATLGLVGYGRIGQAVARRATGFSMQVLHHARTPTGEPGYVDDLDELVAAADIVSLHVPLSDATRHLIDARRLALMKPAAVLVNTARGPVVDEAALADALESGRLFAAGLDVYEREPEIHPRLLAAPRTVLLPHVGSASVATRTAMARLACDGVRAVLSGEVPASCLNPQVLPVTRG